MLRRPLLAATAALALGLTPALAYAAPTAPTAPQAAPAADGPPITHEQNDRVPVGAAWSEHYFGSTDGVELHADVLRPTQLKPTDRSPVILSVGPYFAHIGQTGDDGFTHTGPSERFNDLIDGAELMKRGYTVVLVDLRGFGGSTGCLDWGGAGEQADVDAAIRWSANQPWSNGRVGLYGKSYDGVTGLIGNNLGTPGLEAVVAQEPVWDLYNYLFSNGVPRPNVTGTPRAYNSITALPGMADDTERYKKNADYEKSHPECHADNLKNNNNPDHESPYWKERNLAAQAKGSSTPLFVTQGFLENNTKPEAMEDYLDNHAGEERGWLGPWEHVRGNETDDAGRLKMGREGWFDEVMRFYDEHLKGVPRTVVDPMFAIEDNLGTWRQQPSWTGPRTDFSVNLRSGTFLDARNSSTTARMRSAAQPGQWDMENAPTEPDSGFAQPQSSSSATARSTQAAAVPTSYLSQSRPVARDVRLTGTPKVTMQVDVPDGVTSSQVMVRLWDVAPGSDPGGSQRAVMFNENVARISGDGTLSFELKSTDWKLLAGHSLAVSIGSVAASSNGWIVTPTNQPIRVEQARLDLATQSPAFDRRTEGGRAPWLDRYLAAYTAQIPAEQGTFTVREPRR